MPDQLRTSLADKYASLSDQELLKLREIGPQGFATNEAWELIEREIAERALPVPPLDQALTFPPKPFVGRPNGLPHYTYFALKMFLLLAIVSSVLSLLLLFAPDRKDEATGPTVFRVLAMVGALVLLEAWHNRRTSKGLSDLSAPAPPLPSGIGGWLLLLCISLTLVAPLVTLGTTLSSYVESARYFDRFPGLRIYTFIDTILRAGLMVLSIRAGLGLWRKRAGAVRTAKRYLLYHLGYVSIAVVLPFFAGLPTSANEAMVGRALLFVAKSCLYVALWYLYLTHSKRVQATYLPPSQNPGLTTPVMV